jgi:predicted AlkP superfamily phosphohydrolase/phosphomutase
VKRLLMIGLDGGDLNFIQSRSAALPFFQTRLQSGQTFILETPKALSGSVWPTFYNGANPGIHGIYQHLVWDAQRMGLRRIGSDWCYYKPFWQDIEKAGYQSVVLDVPYSFPVALKQGVEITDWATHGQTRPLSSNHREVLKKLYRFGKSPIGRETPIQKTARELDKIQNQLVNSAALKGKLITELIKDLDWNLFIAVFGETHRGGHIFFSDDDEYECTPKTPLATIYQAVDQALAKIFESLDKDTALVLFSVHGMARDYAQGHMVRPLMKQANDLFLAKYCNISPQPSPKASGLVPLLRRTVPAWVQYPVGAAMPDSVRQWVVEKEITGGLDWSRTPGFALRTDIRTELRLNLVGREAKGFLEPQSKLHHNYIDFIKEVFLPLQERDTGAQLVDEVVDTHALFPGHHSKSLPDLVVTWKPSPAAKCVFSPLVGEVSAQPPSARGGDHTDFGFAVLPTELQERVGLSHITDLARLSKCFFGVGS